jgi:arsenate reductase
MTPKEGDKRDRIAVLFLCRQNAVRSQMAEALLRARFPDHYVAASAGIAPAGVHPLAARVLEEVGISTLGLRSKHVEEFSGRSFNVVATVCGQDELTCPFFPGGRQIHHAFDDPGAAAGSEEERLASFRRTRDEMDAWIGDTFAACC